MMRFTAVVGVMDDEEDVELREGMQVNSEDGQSLGTLASLLVDEEEEQPEFLLVKAAGVDRLIPMEAVLGVGDGALVLDVPATAMGEFPRLADEAGPTSDEIELAYRVYEEHAQYEADEDEE